MVAEGPARIVMALSPREATDCSSPHCPGALERLSGGLWQAVAGLPGWVRLNLPPRQSPLPVTL